ncbi:hypothetical protein SERLA73DRAFT_175886 [Serpula lacrymans var. lacrymans S7.3]|uniref:Uncharacterized protein n=2 Tax=Serpula lacrymans var. lacrymans TaxID=341189 RepID=F8PJH9_SERL3|nr:uncharacterized protein SERLADRAFT_458519 [Serpula lacrymans var. lacrymans S7.9]EGO04117.1 hypothetical protein SERLA73DRAFT_175886 [Serpula lacrymans var. lacrymans S7.3]EGO30044.1 hypothetical protein SERLADRAFT_458519 [Serpula lacrymans var. lacrymans S7.9]
MVEDHDLDVRQASMDGIVALGKSEKKIFRSKTSEAKVLNSLRMLSGHDLWQLREGCAKTITNLARDIKGSRDKLLDAGFLNIHLTMAGDDDSDVQQASIDAIIIFVKND